MKITRRHKKRGSILIIASLFTFLCLLAAFTLFKVLPVEYNAAKKSRIDGAAHYAADAGVKDAVAWIETRPKNTVLSDDLMAEYNSTFGQRRIVGPEWETEASIERIESGHFGITSQAYFRGNKVREVKAQVAFASFSGFALFIDHWPGTNPTPTPGETALIYNLGGSLLTGPFHTNDYFMLAHEGFTESSLGEPSFVSGPYARMTHSRQTDHLGDDLEDFQSDGNAWVSGFSGLNPIFNDSPSHVPYNLDGALEDRYQRVVDGGRGNLSQIDSIDFPDTAQDRDGTLLREKARGIGNTEFQGRIDTGVYVPRKASGEVYGGVYVVGDSDLTLTLDDNGNQVQRFAQTHLAENFVETETVTVTAPRYVRQERATPPEFVEEVVEVPGTRRVIIGYETPTVSDGDGITQPVSVPIYGTEPITTQQVVSVPYDPDVHGNGPFYEYVEDPDNPYEYDTLVSHPIPEEEYDPNNPNHAIQYEEAGDRLYEVVEVSSDSGYQIPSNFTVEGGSSSVAKDNTVFLDHHELKAVVSSGNLNGVTFSDGDIKSFKGTVKGAVTDGPQGRTFTGRTIAASPKFGNKVTITGHVRQFYDGNDAQQGPNNTLLDGEIPRTAQHSLGLIGRDVELEPDFPTNSTPLSIYAVIMAGSGLYDGEGNPLLDEFGHQRTVGGFGTAQSLLEPSAPFGRGNFVLVGGIIEGNARPWFLNVGRQVGLEGQLRFDPSAAQGLRNFPTTRNLRTVRYSEYPDFD